MSETMNYFSKSCVSKHEYNMHKHVYDLRIVNIPKIISYDEATQIMVMEKINNMSVSDMYGEELKCVDKNIIKKIRNIIKTLLKNNIIYPDITGYNFIEYDKKIWIIDFEHASLINPFINKFINGIKHWNLDFK